MFSLPRVRAAPPWLLAVLTGMLGSVVLAVAMFTPAFLPTASPAHGIVEIPTSLGQVGVAIGIGLSLLGWLGLRPAMAAGSAPSAWLVLALWAGPLLLVPPVLSNDPYLYADQGWTVGQGANPYEVGLSALPGPYAEQVDPIWRGSTSVYPALHLIIVWCAAWITGFDPYWGVVAMRIPALAGVILLGLVLPRLAALARVDLSTARWFGLLNPIVILHQIGGAHNDALMVGLVAVALAAAGSPQWRAITGPLVLGLAVAIKQPAAFAGLAVAFVLAQRLSKVPLSTERRGWSAILTDLRRSALPIALTAVLSIVTLVAVSYLLGWRLGWATSLNVPGSVSSAAPVTVIAVLGVPMEVAIWLGRLILVSVVVYAAARYGSANPWRVLVLIFLALALTGPVLHGWYLAWACCFFPLARYSGLAERLMAGLIALMMVYVVMAEYIGRPPLLGQLTIAAVVALIIDRVAYGWPGFLRGNKAVERAIS